MKGFGLFSHFTKSKEKPSASRDENVSSDDYEKVGESFSVSFADVTPYVIDTKTMPMLLRRQRECEIMSKCHLYQTDSEGNIIGRNRLVEYKSL